MSCENNFYLNWDSRFFGFEIYKILVDDYTSVQTLLKKNSNAALTYVFSDKEISEISKDLVDIKVVFCLPSSKFYQNNIDPNCEIYDLKLGNNEELKKLAIISSHMSRFRVDPKISSKKTDELYLKWLENVFENPNEQSIIAYKIDQTIAGFYTLKHRNEDLIIELVAVLPEHQGNGIGHKLMLACINFAKKNNFKNIFVTTQYDNKAACNLYKKSGFQIVEKKFIYHLHKGSK